MSVLPPQLFKKVRDKIVLALGDRFEPPGTARRDEPPFWRRMIRMRQKPLKSHLLKTLHDLLEPLPVQLSGALNACHPFQNLTIRFIIEVEVFFGNMDKGLLFTTDRHNVIITQAGGKREILPVRKWKRY
jgi:hypothetical protein